MQRLIRVTRKVLISCSTIAAVGMLSHTMISNDAAAQAAGGTGGSGGATGSGGNAGTDNPPASCASLGLSNPVYVEGSTAADSVIKALGPALAMATTPLQILYVSGGSIGSCDGVDSIVLGTSSSANATYWNAQGAVQTCSLSNQVMDVGISDVFPTSCPSITAGQLTGVGDFPGPVQSMNFVVPVGATQNSISAEAAYLTVGLGATGGTDWNVPADYAFRNFNSGTETMIATAIKVPTSKWPIAADKGGSGAVVTAIGMAKTPADTTIGILASNQADANRSTIKRLAFQAYGESCALYPDSSYASSDKANVRNGTYNIWGPSHILAKTTAGAATGQAKALIDILEGTTVVPAVDIVNLEILANTTPQCAMTVKRTSEIGTPAPFTPDASCGCYFDSLRGDAAAKAACTACTVATAATDCPAGKTACNHGFCEVK
jgi:hypothetical protein